MQINRARSLYVAQSLATEIKTGRKIKGTKTLMQVANEMTGGKYRTKRDALQALVSEMRRQFGYVPTPVVRRTLAVQR